MTSVPSASRRPWSRPRARYLWMITASLAALGCRPAATPLASPPPTPSIDANEAAAPPRPTIELVTAGEWQQVWARLIATPQERAEILSRVGQARMRERLRALLVEEGLLTRVMKQAGPPTALMLQLRPDAGPLPRFDEIISARDLAALQRLVTIDFLDWAEAIGLLDCADVAPPDARDFDPTAPALSVNAALTRHVLSRVCPAMSIMGLPWRASRDAISRDHTLVSDGDLDRVRDLHLPLSVDGHPVWHEVHAHFDDCGLTRVVVHGDPIVNALASRGDRTKSWTHHVAPMLDRFIASMGFHHAGSDRAPSQSPPGTLATLGEDEHRYFSGRGMRLDATVAWDAPVFELAFSRPPAASKQALSRQCRGSR